ncbi:MAG: glycosyl hydrolase [Verrucomicrobiaceae bacterium]
MKLGLLLLTLSLSLQANTLEWVAAGDRVSIYQQANWMDPATGITAPAGSVVGNTPLDTNLLIHHGTPGGGSGGGADLSLGTGQLILSSTTFRLNRGKAAGIDMGTTNREFSITDSKVFTDHITSGIVTMSGRSELTLYAQDPLTNTTIDLRSSDCFVFFENRLPSEIDGNYLLNFTVSGQPAVLNNNVEIRQHYTGAVLRRKLGSGHALKAFAGPDLTGQRWNLTTGFKGNIGLGLSAFDSGTYTISGWGSDIWGTSDQCHFLYRSLTGDGEIITKVNSIENTHFSAKGGLMIRQDLSAESPNVFLFQRPDKKVLFQSRSTPGASSTSSSGYGDGTQVNWLRLVREGNTFTGYRSIDSASGPWNQIGSPRTVAMTDTVHIGLAVTSHIGIERATAAFSGLTMMQGTTTVGNSDIGIFNDSREIDAAWPIDDQISSFLLKKGYMAVLAEHAGGQGFSQFYAATEADLLVNLPPELDNKVTFMRILPWRWISKKGWDGTNNTFPNTIKAHWKYEWEPTGASTLNWEFVPMIRGRSQDKDFRWEEVRVRGNQTHFLGFNEPEAANQGDLTVDEAIALWPKAQQLGLRLGSPARTDGNNGNNWLQEFMTKADAKGYRVDYTCVHNYNRMSASALKSFLDAEFARYGRPIWLTEFQRAKGDNPTSADHLAYLQEVLPMLEDLDYLERYAYYNFNITGSPNDSASLFNGDDSPNEKGILYRDIGSNSAYRNTGQPAWATASLDLSNNDVILTGDQASITTTISLDPTLIQKVDFFANGTLIATDTTFPYQLPTSSLPPGSQAITALVTTTFAEEITTTARQTFVTDLAFTTPSPGPDGSLTWNTVPGETYRLETSTDLSTWTLLEQRTANSFQDSTTPSNWLSDPQRFYRITWE